MCMDLIQTCEAARNMNKKDGNVIVLVDNQHDIKHVRDALRRIAEWYAPEDGCCTPIVDDICYIFGVCIIFYTRREYERTPGHNTPLAIFHNRGETHITRYFDCEDKKSSDARELITIKMKWTL